MTAPRLSVVIPVYRSEAIVPHLCMGLREALAMHTFEIILVNDRSPDGSWDAAEGLLLNGRVDAGIDVMVRHGHFATAVDFAAQQQALAPPADQTDLAHVIRGVIEAETSAIELYNEIIEVTEGVDPVTNDMVIAILRDEEQHRRLFEGFLREYEVEGRA